MFWSRLWQILHSTPLCWPSEHQISSAGRGKSFSFSW